MQKEDVGMKLLCSFIMFVLPAHCHLYTKLSLVSGTSILTHFKNVAYACEIIVSCMQLKTLSHDIVNDDQDPSPDNCSNSHGTSCAGIIGAAKNDVCGVGIAYNVYLGGQ